MSEKLHHVPTTVYSFNWPEGDERHGVVGREVPNELFDDLKTRPAGYKWRTWAGSPGTGSIVYELVRVDESGAYGRVVSNTVRELTASDVR